MKHHLFTRLVAVIVAVTALCGSMSAAVKWQLVADRTDKMPLEKVVCLVATDNSDRMLVIGTERTLYSVGRVTFEQSGQSSIESVSASTDAPEIISANSTITVMGLSRDDSLTIYGIDGRLVSSRALRAADGTIEVSIADLTPGVYVVNILDSTLKILKK